MWNFDLLYESAEAGLGQGNTPSTRQNLTVAQGVGWLSLQLLLRISSQIFSPTLLKYLRGFSFV